ncbi:MAG: c-type cytochrome [Myxococcota bacterium]|nr:c-type cytochrome [Myxococcota bacterium]
MGYARSLHGVALTAGFLVCLGGSVSAEEALDGAALYKEKTCIACHGADANTPLLPEYPKLAGQNAAYALQQMKDIKSGARDNGNTAAMKGVMHLSNDAELEAIANWLASLAP